MVSEGKTPSRSDEQKQTAPSISLPKGGGVIRGISESKTGPTTDAGSSIIFLAYGTQKSLGEELSSIGSKSDMRFSGKPGESLKTIVTRLWDWVTGKGNEGSRAIQFAFREIQIILQRNSPSRCLKRLSITFSKSG